MCLILGCVIALLGCVRSAPATNQTCPDNLSQNCVCKSDQSGLRVTCNYGNSTVVAKLLNVTISDVNMDTVSFYKLDISKNNLSSLPMDYFDGLSSIIHIDMSENKFLSIPSVLSKLKNVRALDLSSCQVNTINLNDLSDVQFLNLSRNSLQNIDADNLKIASKIKTLDLSSNKLSLIPDGLFQDLKFLQVLNLSNNNLKRITKETFKGIGKSLREVNLANNDMDYIVHDVFATLSGLKILNLSGNRIKNSIQYLKFPNHLTYLDLSNCNIQQINDCNFRNLIDLEFLDLHGNQLPCSCHVTWLYQWVETNQESDPYHKKININPWHCIQNGEKNVSISSFQACESHYSSPIHCDINNPVAMTTELPTLNMEANLEDDTLHMIWDPVNGSVLHEYKIIITDMKSNGQLRVISLHKTSSEYIAKDDQFKSGDFSVCLQVLSNETAAIYEECQELTNSSLQIVIGILAGVVFLIPCIIALIYIIKKDRTYIYTKFEGHDDDEEVKIQSKAHVTKTPTRNASNTKTNSSESTTNQNKVKENLATVPTSQLVGEQSENTKKETIQLQNSTKNNSKLKTGQYLDIGQINLSYSIDQTEQTSANNRDNRSIRSTPLYQVAAPPYQVEGSAIYSIRL